MATPKVETYRRFFDDQTNVAKAKRLIAEGKNDRMVSEILGIKRDAVTKLRHRQGLRTNHRPIKGVRPGAKKAFRFIPKPADRKVLKGAAWRPLKGTEPVSLVDLDPGMCKWPVSDGSSFLFCGQPSGERSYCDHHHQLSVGHGTESERTAHRVKGAA